VHVDVHFVRPGRMRILAAAVDGHGGWARAALTVRVR
jgi:hypothetical protein